MSVADTLVISVPSYENDTKLNDQIHISPNTHPLISKIPLELISKSESTVYRQGFFHQLPVESTDQLVYLIFCFESVL